MKLFQVTNSSIATSFLWVAYSLPAILAGPFASVYVDMTDRKKLLILTNFFQFLVIFIYAFIYSSRIFLVYGVAFVYSFLNQFYVPSESASLPELVEKSFLPQANGLFFLTQQFSLMVGFGFAGLLSKALGFQGALILCSLCLFIAFISVSFLPSMKTSKLSARGFEDLLFKFFGRIKEGYRFIRTHNKVLFPFLLLLSLEASLSIVMVNVPLFAKDILMIDYESAGVWAVVPAGLGAALGAILVPSLMKKKNLRKKRIVETSLFAVSLLLFFLSFILLWLGGWLKPLVSSLIILLLGFSFIAIIIPTQTFLQETVPGGLRGRIFGNFWFMVTIATIIPVIFSGTLAEFFGARPLILLLASFSFLGYIFARKKGGELIA